MTGLLNTLAKAINSEDPSRITLASLRILNYEADQTAPHSWAVVYMPDTASNTQGRIQTMRELLFRSGAEITGTLIFSSGGQTFPAVWGSGLNTTELEVRAKESGYRSFVCIRGESREIYSQEVLIHKARSVLENPGTAVYRKLCAGIGLENLCIQFTPSDLGAKQMLSRYLAELRKVTS